ncbi:MAG: exodeoxyribonuclease VII large subunit [Sandaracinaceae bacterium]
MQRPATERPRIYRVGELARRVRARLENWGEVWVEGELRDVTRGGSGHLYFTLEDADDDAQLRAVMFRTDARFARARMAEGERVRIAGRFTLYEPRGGLQLVARLALPAGEGDRAAELARRRAQLAAEGLLDPARKRPLPVYPRGGGGVTSRDAAALHDVLQVARGRAPVRLVVSHARVQGLDAPASLVRALRRLGRVPGVEVVVVCRGGGARTDLSAFDHLGVAREVARCPVPVVSGLGHGADETLVDLVADARAATPSNAIERVVPEPSAVLLRLGQEVRRLSQALEITVGRRRLRLGRLERRLAGPRAELRDVASRVREAHQALERAAERRLRGGRRRLAALRERIARQEPRSRLRADRVRLLSVVGRLAPALQSCLEGARRRQAAGAAALHDRAAGRLWPRRMSLASLAGRLESLSPLAVLARGYGIVLHEGRALLDPDRAAPGDPLEIRLHRGVLRARVEDPER